MYLLPILLILNYVASIVIYILIYVKQELITTFQKKKLFGTGKGGAES